MAYENNVDLLRCFCVWSEDHGLRQFNHVAMNLFDYKPYGKKIERIGYRYLLRESRVFLIFYKENYRNSVDIFHYSADEILIKFDKWFTEMRKKSMKNKALEMAKHNEKIFKPTSHSGIASLLTVLTKTMEKQGADITSIAKVQYAVCVQAGVYIPDEFLLDVAVALDVEEGKV